MGESTTTTSNGLTRRNYFVPDTLHERMQKRAAKTGIIVSEQLRIALAEYLDKHEPVAKS